jgi:hypothetical protein
MARYTNIARYGTGSATVRVAADSPEEARSAAIAVVEAAPRYAGLRAYETRVRAVELREQYVGLGYAVTVKVSRAR